MGRAFDKINPWQVTVDEQIVEAKASAAPMFDTEKTEIRNFRVANLQRLKSLSEIATIPEKSEHHRYITHNAFNAFTWIDFFCSRFPEFAEVYITSYNFGEAPIKLLFEKFDQGIFKSLSFIISESIRYRMPQRYFQLRDGIIERRSNYLRMAGIWNHSKIILLKTLCGNHFVIEGSGNFSENAYIEQYSLDNSEQIYNFHKSWIDDYVFNVDGTNLKRHFVITGGQGNGDD